MEDATLLNAPAKTLRRTKEERKTTECDLHPNPLKSSRVRRENGLFGRAELISLRYCFLIYRRRQTRSLIRHSAACKVYLRLGEACVGIMGNLDWRQNRQKEGTKTERKTAALSLALLLGPHGSPGTLARKRSPLHVLNKCHLTLGEALAPASEE